VTYRDEIQPLVDQRGSVGDSERLHRLFDLSFANSLAESPESATILGQPGHNHRWTDWSPDAVERRHADTRLTLRVLDSIDRSTLGAADALSYDVFRHLAADADEGTAFPDELLAVNQLDGVQVDAAFVLAAMPAANRRHVDDVLARLRALPEVVEQTIARLDRGIAGKVTTPAVTLRDVPDQILASIPEDARTSPLLAPLRAAVQTLGAADAEEALGEAVAVVAAEVAPSFRRLHAYLTGTYLPAARTTVALGDLPDGQEWYAHRVRSYTTTDASAEEIHRIGLAEVERIGAEMAALRHEVAFEGSAADFADFMRTDPRFTFDTPQALLAFYRDIAKRIDATVLRLFRTLPRLPFGIVEVPAEQAPSAPAAFYLPGSLEDGRPGQFFANTHDLAARPSWNMESICLHEAVPGHHFQLTLAQELGDVPTFRRYAFITAYLEGWGLYCESLGEELGLYTDPYQRYGSLDAEILRAIRLVVDTGIHALGWTRDQAIAFFAEHSASPHHEIVTEVDRYIVLPGQALAYKTGELKLKELRARSSAALGDAFDVRSFHDELLRHGALPLGLLETMIDDWTAGQAAPDAAGA
jgi:uncharacterized protein (DUF885 family)